MRAARHRLKEHQLMIDSVFAPLGILLLRWFLAALLLERAWFTLRVFTLQGSARQYAARGLPPLFAYAAVAAQMLGALCLLLGIYPRVVALVMVLAIACTVAMAAGPRGWLYAGARGDWRQPAMVAVLLLMLVFLGDGPATLVASPGFDAGV
jgi:putative oxidoreductase